MDSPLLPLIVPALIHFQIVMKLSLYYHIYYYIFAPIVPCHKYFQKTLQPQKENTSEI